MHHKMFTQNFHRNEKTTIRSIYVVYLSFLSRWPFHMHHRHCITSYMLEVFRLIHRKQFCVGQKCEEGKTISIESVQCAHFWVIWIEKFSHRIFFRNSITSLLMSIESTEKKSDTHVLSISEGLAFDIRIKLKIG